ncbi:probable membrane protein YCR013c-yeast (ISS) [Eubacterium sp. CAG:786]|nr:probable membrane protein YCR013c-yeast (ISS) [Eubacterium sp. CAG:786]
MFTPSIVAPSSLQFSIDAPERSLLLKFAPDKFVLSNESPDILHSEKLSIERSLRTNKHSRISFSQNSLPNLQRVIEHSPTTLSRSSYTLLPMISIFNPLQFIRRRFAPPYMIVNYLSWIASMPGRPLPSRYSREAPPPVEMWLILSA